MSRSKPWRGRGTWAMLAFAVVVALLRLQNEPPTQEKETPDLVQKTATVMGIDDGDSFRVEIGNKTYRVRVAGIDCPEHMQPFSRKARDLTTDLIDGKTVTLRIVDRDQYGRIVADVLLPDGRSLAEVLLTNGLAWWYQTIQPDNRTYERLEAEARTAGRGLWAEKDPIPPWRWRREHQRTSNQTQRQAVNEDA